MKTLVTYSNKFQNKCLNNYDNQVKNDMVGVYEKLNSKATQHLYQNQSSDLGRVNSFEIHNVRTNLSEPFKTPLREKYNETHVRANSFQVKAGGIEYSADKSEYKKKMMEKLNKWSYFDTNINNTLVEQRKILNRKNYELDSRANALKDYGYVPYVAGALS